MKTNYYKKRDSLKAFFLSLCMLPFMCINAQSPDMNGVWVLEKIEITLTKDGQSAKKVYTKRERFETPTISIEELEFAPGNNLSVLFKGWDKTETSPYVISGDTLTWNHPTANYKFNIQFDNERLVMQSEGVYAMDGDIRQYKYVHYLIRR